jgi:hypothetical protein
LSLIRTGIPKKYQEGNKRRKQKRNRKTKKEQWKKWKGRERSRDRRKYK